MLAVGEAQTFHHGLSSHPLEPRALGAEASSGQPGPSPRIGRRGETGPLPWGATTGPRSQAMWKASVPRVGDGPQRSRARASGPRVRASGESSEEVLRFMRWCSGLLVGYDVN